MVPPERERYGHPQLDPTGRPGNTAAPPRTLMERPMALFDLTMPIGPVEALSEHLDQAPRPVPALTTHTWHIEAHPHPPYQARVHVFSFWGMAGTYIDFPGHIVETDDGQDAASVTAECLFRIPATLIRLDRSRQPGPVSAADLQAACDSREPVPGLVINALGKARCDQIPDRSVYLAADAVRWIVDRGTRLLVADVYESNDQPQDVFRTLFTAGVATVCRPDALGVLPRQPLRLTALPLRCAGATQLPCRLLAETEPS